MTTKTAPITQLDPFKGTKTVQKTTGLELAPIAGARYVAPALIDLVSFPQEPGNEHRETLRALSEAARIGGVGCVGLMPDVDPVADHDGVIRTLQQLGGEADTGIRLLPHGALSTGLRHEDIAPMGELKASGVRVITDGGRPVTGLRFLRRSLEYARNFNLPVLLTPQDPDLAGKGLAPEGAEATRFGLPPIPDAAERIAVMRACELAMVAQAEILLFPIVTRAGLEALTEARSRGARVRAGTALPYLQWTVHDLQTYDSLYRVHPPLSREDDVTALVEAVRNKTIDFLATGHCAVDLSEKQTELAVAKPGMAVLAHTWTLLHKIAAQHDLDLLDLVHAMTVGPAQILGLDPWDVNVVIHETDAMPVFGAHEDQPIARNMPSLDGPLLTATWTPSPNDFQL